MPQDGSPDLYNATIRLLLGNVGEQELKRVCSVQSLSGSGALKIAGEVLKKQLNLRQIAMSNPTWANHTQMFTDMEFKLLKYR